MSSGTFAAFSKFHLNTSKYTLMKVVQLVEGHNFRVEWHFKFLSAKGWKTWSISSTSCSPRHGGIQSWQAVPAKTIVKNTYEPL
jgi:hypothetical protein